MAEYICRKISCTVDLLGVALSTTRGIYRNAMHKFEQCHHHFLLYSDRLSSMGMLSLYKWSKVIYQPIKNILPHSQDVVEHVKSIDVENILFKPTFGPRFNIPLCIQTTNVLSRGQKILYYMSVPIHLH